MMIFVSFLCKCSAVCTDTDTDTVRCCTAIGMKEKNLIFSVSLSNNAFNCK